MKHFLIDIKYLVPVEQLAEILPKHRAFLQTGYDRNLLLLSGPKEPRIGGLIVARAKTLSELGTFFDNDPYKINNLAAYTIIEFNPVLFQPRLEEWIKG
ncbi:MAG TPA: YciI family protein [Leptolinea sp.]